ncbi:MAG: MBL fold metallo-hydrolase [Calditerrivibrio sp.]|nr:MBL fold metallo-hydrolase [Calditerrivibrio sp.]
MYSYLTDRIFTIDLGPNMIMGCDTDDESVILFDTCIDESVAKKIDKIAAKPVKYILNSHSHADHTGGNYYFQKKYNTKIYIDSREISFCELPELETALLNGGYGLFLTKDKFLCAKKSFADRLDKFDLRSYGIETFDLAGHSPGMTGFKVEDICYFGDAVFSREIIDKYKILYLYDVSRFRRSLDKLLGVPYEKCVICHKGVFDKSQMEHVVNLNKKHVEQVKNIVYDNIDDNIGEREIFLKVVEKLDIELSKSIYLLIFSTIKGYLFDLLEEGLVEVNIDKGFLWKKI